MEQDEIVPILKPCPFWGPASDRAHRHIHGSVPRLRGNRSSGSQHGACGSQMEQEKGGRFWLTIDVESSRDREWGL